MLHFRRIAALVLAAAAPACSKPDEGASTDSARDTTSGGADVSAALAKYTPVRLTADLSALSDSERKMIPILI